MKTKQVYMLTNGYAILPQGQECFLYAGLGYELIEQDAIALINNGLALEMEDVSAEPEVKDSSSRGSSNSNRGKGLLKGRRKRRGQSNLGNDKGRNKSA